MSYTSLLATFGLLAAMSPAMAAQSEPMPDQLAPAAGPNAKYCLRIEPITGSRIEQILCETREEWALLGVDVDREWAEEGVRVIG